MLKIMIALSSILIWARHKGPWVLHPYKFSSKSIKRLWRSSRNAKSWRTDDGCRTMDRRRTDGALWSSGELKSNKASLPIPEYILVGQKLDIAKIATLEEECVCYVWEDCLQYVPLIWYIWQIQYSFLRYNIDFRQQTIIHYWTSD